MTTLPRRPVLLLPCALLLGALAGCVPHGTVERPTGELPPLQLTLHARSDTYALDLGGRAPHQYRDELDAQVREFLLRGPGFFHEGNTLEPAPAVDLELEVRNTSPRDVEFHLGGGADLLNLELFGPEVVRVEGPGLAALGPGHEPAPPRRVQLAPGESYFEPLQRLEVAHPLYLSRWYWTRPGEYTVVATWHLPDPARPGGLVLRSNPATLTVCAP